MSSHPALPPGLRPAAGREGFDVTTLDIAGISVASGTRRRHAIELTDDTRALAVADRPNGATHVRVNGATNGC